MMNGEDTENYVEASLPDEMSDMQDGEEKESVCKVKRKGDKMCITHVGGTKISPYEKAAKESTKASESENPGPKKGESPSSFMRRQPGMQSY